MEIRLSRPCIEDPLLYIAECNLEKKVDIEKLCTMLREIGAIDLKCSVKLGVARFLLEGRSVMIYKSGRMDIRKIRNTGEAETIMKKILETVKESLIDISF
ncbi:MAG: hypothetical protein J5U19_07570 [Candidatus Methanoperedens sp.]|nr:hypothetical protein [Candidatus Methanoperedens sp.]MCE8428227.1 hypothetical protein [Candidatus Methanoperedens sp.]